VNVPEQLPTDDEGFADFVEGLNYTMFLVTTTDGTRRDGCLVGFATQTSIDPVQFLICLSRSNVTTRIAARNQYLAVHQIGPDQKALARLFGEESGEWLDKFAQCEWADGPHGVPLLAGVPAWFVARVDDILDLGDHAGLLVVPVAAAGTRVPGLTFSDLRDLEPGQSA
jgi:flavin reductase (DIM6/NTAB) family NADH-FMN oxidoreductase RutF